MDGVSVIARIILEQQQTQVTFAVVALVLVPLATVLARRAGGSWWRTGWAGLAGVGTALAVAVTLGRYDSAVAPHWRVRCLLQPGLSLGSPEHVLNLLLCTPAAFFGVLAGRRFLPVLVVAAALSGLVEVLQAAGGMGVCQTSDVVRNVAGAALAGGLARALVHATATATGSAHPRPEPAGRHTEGAPAATDRMTS